MSYKSDLHAVIHANRMSSSVFKLLGLLENLGVVKAVFVHQDDVKDFVDKVAEKRYIAYMEIFTDDGMD